MPIDEPEDIYEIENIVRDGDSMRVRLRSNLAPETIVELEPLPILTETPPLEAPPGIQVFSIPTLGFGETWDPDELIPFTILTRGDVDSALLDFGDGSEPLELVDEEEGFLGLVEHAYSVADTYTATLTVTGPGGEADGEITDIVVAIPPP